MALIFCPSCGNQVSDKSALCVKCGFSIEKRIKAAQLPNLKSDIRNAPAQSVLIENKSNQIRNKAIFVIATFVVSILVFYNTQKVSEVPSSNASSGTTNQNSKQPNSDSFRNTCEICGSSFKGNGYVEESNGFWVLAQDPYQSYICSKRCGMKHTRTMNGYLNSTRKNLNDGRIYESNSCGLCKGTGIERGYNAFTNEYDSRLCPMCDGKGVRGY